jgi:hypothetical protein
MWTERKFYVYVYLDPRKQGNFVYDSYILDHEPFYVGKGEKKRVFNLKKHKTGACKNKIQKLKSLNLEPIIRIIKIIHSEYIAHVLEKKLINLIGRHDLGLGTLCNHTDGGEGCCGRKIKFSDEHKRKIGLGNKGKIRSEEQKRKFSEKMKGRIISEIVRLKISKKLKGKIVSKETRLLMSQAQKGNKHCLGRILSEETKRRIGERNKGKIPTKETRLLMSQAHKGRIISEETKRRMSKAKIKSKIS